MKVFYAINVTGYLYEERHEPCCTEMDEAFERTVFFGEGDRPEISIFGISDCTISQESVAIRICPWCGAALKTEKA